MNNLSKVQKDLRKLVNPQKARLLQRFFKTGKGEYGEGDVFLGITVPKLRKIAVKFKDLRFPEISQLLKSKIHEERLVALLILVHNFNLGNEKQPHLAKASRGKKKIFDFYLKNTKYINNWDLVDLSADKIVGGYLFDRLSGSSRSLNDSSTRNRINLLSLHENFLQNPKSVARFKSSFREEARPPAHFASFILIKLAKSKNIWERRIAILSTFQFIKNNRFDETLKIAEMLLQDKHDLIHKAVGWMLREVGKKDLETEEEFLKKHYQKMPRTMLRYAIEKLPEKTRLSYLQSRL